MWAVFFGFNVIGLMSFVFICYVLGRITMLVVFVGIYVLVIVWVGLV